MSREELTSPPAKRLVFIAGSGHSGSTLLEMALGGHPQVVNLGEVHRLFIDANRNTQTHLCTCGEQVMRCPFWSKVALELQELLATKDPDILAHHVTTDPRLLDFVDNGKHLVAPAHLGYARGVKRETMLALVLGVDALWKAISRFSADSQMRRTATINSLAIHEAARRAAGVPVVIESGKAPSRMKGFYLASSLPMSIIYLVRDGRAVCLSRMKREGIPMAPCARRWKTEQRMQRVTFATVSSKSIINLRYEDLCREPRTVLSEICRFIGLKFDDEMLNFRHERHNLGGNPMRFRKGETEIKLDEKWKQELSSEDLQTFEEIAGDTNRRLGYRDS